MTIDMGAAPAATAKTFARDDLLCPLCDYPLRGLIDPRCPECGHTFDWDELVTRETNRHPFLFESQPKRNVWSFFKTFLAGLRPRRFFTLLKPSEPIHIRRLIVYWVLCVMLLPLASAVNVARMTLRDYQASKLYWQRMPTVWNSLPPNDQWKGTMIRRFGSLSNYLAFSKPTIRNTFQQTLRYGNTVGLLTSGVALLLWPWLTFFALMIFRYSLRLARIRSIHVLRVAIYSCDAVSVLLMISVLILPSGHSYIIGPFSAGLSGLIFTSMLFGAYVSWRLGEAYKRYLRFEHPFLTAFASQVIVFLATLVLAMQWFYY
jgi:hypothetical protein